MPEVSLMPLAGINNVAEDALLHRGGDQPRHFVRDAVNVLLTPAGKAHLRPCIRRVSTDKLRSLWQSPLHRDVFAARGDQWGRVYPSSWEFEPLALIGHGDVTHIVLNNRILIAGDAGIFEFNGDSVRRMTIDAPSAPMLSVSGGGSLPAGRYGVSVAWMRDGEESPLSVAAHADVPENGILSVTLPMSLDSSVTHTQVYMTSANGGELRGVQSPVGAVQFSISTPPLLGMRPPFQYMDPMPTGKYLSYWRGRLLTARANVLRFSEPMAYHINDPRHGFVQMPQRITFVVPVDGGIWVGQVDHVVFLDGDQPKNMVAHRKAALPPVPDSAITVDADLVGGDTSQSGGTTALWLADNGYVAGSPTGQLIELHAGVLRGVTGKSGTTTVLDRRLLTVVR